MNRTAEVRIIRVRGKRRAAYRNVAASGSKGSWHRMTVADAEEALACSAAGQPYHLVTQPATIVAA